MTEAKIRKVVEEFAAVAKKIYGSKLISIILYGSCARGDFKSDSDIDLMVLLNVPKEEINAERKRIYDISDKLDLDYDVVLTPVFQSYPLFQKYMSHLFFIKMYKEKVSELPENDTTRNDYGELSYRSCQRRFGNRTSVV